MTNVFSDTLKTSLLEKKAYRTTANKAQIDYSTFRKSDTVIIWSNPLLSAATNEKWSLTTFSRKEIKYLADVQDLPKIFFYDVTYGLNEPVFDKLVDEIGFEKVLYSEFNPTKLDPATNYHLPTKFNGIIYNKAMSEMAQSPRVGFVPIMLEDNKVVNTPRTYNALEEVLKDKRIIYGGMNNKNMLSMIENSGYKSLEEVPL